MSFLEGASQFVQGATQGVVDRNDVAVLVARRDDDGEFGPGCGRSLRVELRLDVAVDVERDLNPRVSEPLLHNLWVHIFIEQQRRRGVPQIVKADAW